MAIARRISVLAGVMASAIALILSAPGASAQVGGPGAQATPVVGVSGTAFCPTNVGANQVSYAGPAGALTIVSSAGSCSSFSANSAGTFTAGGNTGDFSSGCQAGPPPTGSSTVTVPTGTSVNGGAPVLVPTVVTTPNTPVTFPGGATAVLNVQTVSGSTLTQTAIVVGGVSIGRVICGAANVYPLAVDAAAGAPAVPPALTGHSSSSGGHTVLLLLGAGVALALLGQVTIGRRLSQRRDAAAG